MTSDDELRHLLKLASGEYLEQRIIGAERQSVDLATEVLSKLPPGHPAVQILDTSKHPLPHDALDQLGNARTVEAVHWLLGNRIVERPSILVQ